MLRRVGIAAVALVCVIGALSWTHHAAAQYGSQVDVDAVVVPVTVRDAKGRVVKGVDRKKFQLLVDGYKVPIRDLHLENDLPISLGFILDTSGSMAGRKLDGSRNLIMAFLGTSTGGPARAVDFRQRSGRRAVSLRHGLVPAAENARDHQTVEHHRPL